MGHVALISVIVLTHGNSDKIKNCLDSIMNQTYKNIEIIIVDDNSNDDIAVLLDFDKNTGRKTKIISLEDLEKNQEKFKARLVGASAAKGEYLMFVDSDDTISIDYCRMMVDKAIKETADIVISEIAVNQPDGNIQYYNLDIFRLQDIDLKENEIFDSFIRTKGLFCGWYSISNKLYSKKLWDTCEETFTKFSLIENEVNYGDEIIFSFCLWSRASHVVNVHNIYYFSTKHELKKKDNDSPYAFACKYVNSVAMIFNFIETFLRNANILNQYKTEFSDFRLIYIKKLYIKIKNAIDSVDEKKILKLFQKQLSIVEDALEIKKSDIFLESYLTNLYPQYRYYEDIKRFISSSECEYVFFDIFDTLLERPFFYPTDLFLLLDTPFNDLIETKGMIDFSEIRKNGEQGCREYYYSKRPHFEDVTIDEIYDYISEFYAIDKNVTDKLKEIEIDLEFRYCSQRKIGKELFDLAKYCKKKIGIASDMYLPKNIIDKLLKKNGYDDYILFVSNDVGASKHSGELYRYIIEALNIQKPQHCCFIGDNFYSDIEQSKKYRFVPYHVPKATDIFCNINQFFTTGSYYEKIYKLNGSIIDSSSSLYFYLGIRSMIAVAANLLYGGNPFIAYNKETDYNLDPRIIGIFPFGMFLLSLSKWLVDDSQTREVDTIHFVARDGYIVKQACDIIARHVTNTPKTNYLYASRKALAPMFVSKSINICECFNSKFILNQSPKKIINLLKDIIPKEKYQHAEEICNRNFFTYTKIFHHADSFYRFLKFFDNEFYSSELSASYAQNLKLYFEDIISENDAIFDIGYSGRTEFVLSNLLGFPINSYYLHVHEDIAFKRKVRGKIQNQCFYNYKPISTFVVREHLFLPQQPSCIGYDVEKKQPLFEEYNSDYSADYVSKIIHNSAIIFIETFMENFGDVFSQMHFRYYDAAIPFETFLHYPKPMDMELFSTIDLEDDFGMGGVNLTEYWLKELQSNRNFIETQHPNSEDYPSPPFPPAEPASPNNKLADLYEDGLFVAFFRKLNKLLPKGSRRRDFFKKIASVFIKS